MEPPFRGPRQPSGSAQPIPAQPTTTQARSRFVDAGEAQARSRFFAAGEEADPTVIRATPAPTPPAPAPPLAEEDLSLLLTLLFSSASLPALLAERGMSLETLESFIERPDVIAAAESARRIEHFRATYTRPRARNAALNALTRVAELPRADPERTRLAATAILRLLTFESRTRTKRAMQRTPTRDRSRFFAESEEADPTVIERSQTPPPNRSRFFANGEESDPTVLDHPTTPGASPVPPPQGATDKPCLSVLSSSPAPQPRVPLVAAPRRPVPPQSPLPHLTARTLRAVAGAPTSIHDIPPRAPPAQLPLAPGCHWRLARQCSPTSMQIRAHNQRNDSSIAPANPLTQQG